MQQSTTALFIWFAKSDLPVVTIRAPALKTSSGMISGSGLLKSYVKW